LMEKTKRCTLLKSQLIGVTSIGQLEFGANDA
jgi:hypothetical protein